MGIHVKSVQSSFTSKRFLFILVGLHPDSSTPPCNNHRKLTQIASKRKPLLTPSEHASEWKSFSGDVFLSFWEPQGQSCSNGSATPFPANASLARQRRRRTRAVRPSPVIIIYVTATESNVAEGRGAWTIATNPF